MKLYNPITTILKKSNGTGEPQYYLHAVTLIDSNIYKPDGFRINRNGAILGIDLLITRDQRIEHLGVLSPVVHNVPLGILPGDGTKINVELKYNERFVGRSTTGDDHAEEDEKPIPPFL